MKTRKLRYDRVSKLVLMVLLGVYAGMTSNWLALAGFIATFHYSTDAYHKEDAIRHMAVTLLAAREYIAAQLKDDGGADDGSRAQ